MNADIGILGAAPDAWRHARRAKTIDELLDVVGADAQDLGLPVPAALELEETLVLDVAAQRVADDLALVLPVARARASASAARSSGTETDSRRII
jgi:hypothetical protein